MDTEMAERTFDSTADGAREPYLLYLPESTTPVPLVVGLHTWSCDRFNQMDGMLTEPHTQEYIISLKKKE